MGKLSEEEATAILKKTYKKYVEEPELTTRLENIPKLLAKFDGNYDTMIKKLLQKYAKEAKAKPKKKAAEAEEVASAALFLASSQSDFISGVELPIDGGEGAG